VVSHVSRFQLRFYVDYVRIEMTRHTYCQMGNDVTIGLYDVRPYRTIFSRLSTSFSFQSVFVGLSTASSTDSRPVQEFSRISVLVALSLSFLVN
jgi:hypothetical protein